MISAVAATCTNVLIISIFLNAFKYYRMRYGASQASILFVMVTIITLINFRFQKQWVHYQ